MHVCVVADPHQLPTEPRPLPMVALLLLPPSRNVRLRLKFLGNRTPMCVEIVLTF